MNNEENLQECTSAYPTKALRALLRDVAGEDLFALSKEQITEKAEKYLDTPLPFLPLSLYRAYSKDGKREPFEDRYTMRRNMMLTFILAEAADKKGKYTDKICDLLWAISEESSWVLPRNTEVSPTFPGTDIPEVFSLDALHGIDLYSLGTAVIFCCIYAAHLDFSLRAVSDILPERAEFEVYDRCITPFLNIGLYPSVRCEEAYGALDYIVACGILPKEASMAVQKKLSGYRQ